MREFDDIPGKALPSMATLSLEKAETKE